MVWGCFSYHGVGPIVLIEGTMTADSYIEIMKETMLPYAEECMPVRWRFQQDNDPKHTAKKTKIWFNENRVDVIDWPAQSPDLNPIENLWAIVKKEVAKTKPRNKAELWSHVKSAWEAIPVITCQKLAESVPRRLQAVLKQKGHITKC